MGVGEAQAFAGETIDIGRLNSPSAVTTHVAITKIVRVDEKDVRFLRAECGGTGKKKRGKKGERFHPGISPIRAS